MKRVEGQRDQSKQRWLVMDKKRIKMEKSRTMDQTSQLVVQSSVYWYLTTCCLHMSGRQLMIT